jgi:hypothetical protein
LQEALHEKMKQNEAATASQAPAETVKKQNPENPRPAPEHHTVAAMPQPAPAPVQKPARNSVEPSMSLPQLTGPPSSLSSAKQQKLDELLQQYRADQLTPQQYHEQRAKILSEP